MRARKLKCWVGNYDGRRRGLIIAYSKREAAAVLLCSVKSFSDYWGEVGPVPAGLKPRTIYTAPYNDHDAEFVEGQCELPPRARLSV